MPQDYSVSRIDLRAPLIAKLRRGLGLGWLRVLVLVILDSLTLSLAWIIADTLGTPVNSFQLLGGTTQHSESFLLPIVMIYLGILAASGLYSTDDRRRSFLSLFKALTLGQIVLLNIVFFYEPNLVIARSTFLIAWLLSLAFVFAERFLLHTVIVNLRQQGSLRQTVFLIGNPGDIEKARKRLDKSAQFDVKGEADLAVRSNSKEWTRTLESIQKSGINEVFICSWDSIEDPIFLFWELKNAGLDLRVLPVSLELPSQWTEVKMIDGFTTIRFRSPPIVGSDFWIKRGFDLVASVTIVLLISPLLLAITILIKFDSPGPIFYKQERVGLKGRRFKVWKFRTMVVNADKLQKELEAKNEMKGGILFKLKDDPRITRIGRFLRQYSLDELPQLINVLMGKMSLVGPRPLPMRDVERFEDHHQIRHEVLPGITGLWQISGRSNVEDSEEVFRLDMAYIQNWSLSLDFQILLQTVKVVFGKEGAY
ncbi:MULTISPECIES: sugar transferase [unclassified Coleofasciculus]|uniref:sugar transferase n=1 Tax=unclassified Coleofasciculus TaxID=2692782 RepID=UPI00187E0DBE|nr:MULTISPECIES: sugar transferase [unclassified Coleofasciculus]MBE9125328.1 sugar transferase [Coleofasciculus sp. LEGE 07081]MBE9148531.1 sugar transferase [Coleofasciculus sp. LEGE 07092]